MRVLDRPLARVPCVSQTAYRPCEDCVSERDCVVRPVFKAIRDQTARVLDGTTLAAAAAEAHQLDRIVARAIDSAASHPVGDV